MDEEPRWRRLFDVIDRNGDGMLSRIEVIKTINGSPALAHELHELLGTPEHIRQEDGTRDVFVRIFDELDEDDSGRVDMDEFMSYLRRTEARKTAAAAAAAAAAETTEQDTQDAAEDIAVDIAGNKNK